MKKTIAFLLVVSCVFLFGCDKGEDDVDGFTASTWVYVNNTEYTIKVEGGRENFTIEPTKSHSL